MITQLVAHDNNWISYMPPSNKYTYSHSHKATVLLYPYLSFLLRSSVAAYARGDRPVR